MKRKPKSEPVEVTISLSQEEYKSLRGKLALAIQMARSGFSQLNPAESVLARAIYEHERDGAKNEKAKA